jgi:hypothetical protein
MNDRFACRNNPTTCAFARQLGLRSYSDAASACRQLPDRRLFCVTGDDDLFGAVVAATTLTACNALLGIGEPSVEPADAASTDSAPNDAAPGDTTVPLDAAPSCEAGTFWNGTECAAGSCTSTGPATVSCTCAFGWTGDGGTCINDGPTCAGDAGSCVTFFPGGGVDPIDLDGTGLLPVTLPLPHAVAPGDAGDSGDAGDGGPLGSGDTILNVDTGEMRPGGHPGESPACGGGGGEGWIRINTNGKPLDNGAKINPFLTSSFGALVNR